jgi:hypothetical protein
MRYTQAYMQRSIAIVLALVFSSLLIAPALAAFAAPESNLPACCRKNGAHHCSMMQNSMMQGAASSNQGTSVAAIGQKCPYSPKGFVAAHPGTSLRPSGAAVFAGFISHPSISAEAEAGFRVSHHRSRQKRGPPSSLFS